MSVNHVMWFGWCLERNWVDMGTNMLSMSSGVSAGMVGGFSNVWGIRIKVII